MPPEPHSVRILDPELFSRSRAPQALGAVCPESSAIPTSHSSSGFAHISGLALCFMLSFVFCFAFSLFVVYSPNVSLFYHISYPLEPSVTISGTLYIIAHEKF